MNKYFLTSYPFGVAGGILCILAFLVMLFMGFEPVSMNLVFGYIITPVFIFLGIKNFRDRYNGGTLYFSQGMTLGFVIYTLMALISACFVFVYMQFNAAVFEEFRQVNLAMMADNREVLIEQLNQEAYEETYRSIEKMTKLDVATNDLLRKIIPGLFFTIIISIILKRTVQPLM